MKSIFKKGSLALLGAVALALPMALPATAHADSWHINLGLGVPVAQPVYYRPEPVMVRYVPAPAPVRVTNYYPYPRYQRVVYGRPYYRHYDQRRVGWFGPGRERVAYGW